MSADIEQRTDGSFSYVGVREPAWHQLGVTYPNADGITVEQALQDLDAGTIESIPVYGSRMTEDGVQIIDAPRLKMNIRVRQSGPVFLGVTGTKYTVIDEHEGFAFLQNLVDSGDALVSSAGFLDDGKRAFCCMRMPREIQIGGVDPIDLFLLGAMAHDGSMSYTCTATPIRVVCQNTLTMALAGAQNVWRVRHTSNAKLRVEEARRALELTFKYADVWTELAESLVAKTCTDRRFEAIITELFGPSEDAPQAVQTKWDTKRGELFGLWNADTVANVKGTAWGALNAVTEWIDWERPVRGADDADVAALRFERSLTGNNGTEELKQAALAVVKRQTR